MIGYSKTAIAFLRCDSNDLFVYMCFICWMKTRNNFLSTKQEVEKLMNRVRSADQDQKPPGHWTMEGYLYVQEKRKSYRASLQSFKHQEWANRRTDSLWPSIPDTCKSMMITSLEFSVHAFLFLSSLSDPLFFLFLHTANVRKWQNKIAVHM